jgi:hypothetical protein
MSFRAGKSSAAGNGALSSGLLPTLNKLAAREAMELLQAEAVKDAAHRAGISPERLMDREDDGDREYRLLTGNASPIGSSEPGHASPTRLRIMQGLQGASAHSFEAQPDGKLHVNSRRGTCFSGPKLGSLPPTSNTWSRLTTAKYVVACTNFFGKICAPLSTLVHFQHWMKVCLIAAPSP